MPKKLIDEKGKQACWERARREFPGNKALQELHFIRYCLEQEWQEMSWQEIREQIEAAKKELGV